jgi:hypothetical protein
MMAQAPANPYSIHSHLLVGKRALAGRPALKMTVRAGDHRLFLRGKKRFSMRATMVYAGSKTFPRS